MAVGEIMTKLQRENALQCFTSTTGVGNNAKCIYETLAQFSSSEITPQTLKESAKKLPDGALKKKIVDLALIYEGYSDFLKTKEYLDDNFFMDISLASLESLFQVNQYRLCREFRAHFLMPPIQYLHLARINKARTLLTETCLKIHEISYQVGYENTNHFIHHFKKIIGQTPAAYREKRIGVR